MNGRTIPSTNSQPGSTAVKPNGHPMRFTSIEDTHPPSPDPRRNLLTCPACLRDAMELIETDKRRRAAEKGALVAIRTWKCRTEGCHAIDPLIQTRVQTYDISVGPVVKGYSRTYAEARSIQEDDRGLVTHLSDNVVLVVRI